MIVYGADQAVADWVSFGLGSKQPLFTEKFTAIGVVEDSKLLAGIVYHNYIKTIDSKPLFIEMSIYSVDKRWCSRHNLRNIFLYPFIQLNLERTQAICAANDEGVIMFLERLGFKKEGLHRKAHLTGGDALSFGMLKDECKWIR